jgi:thrombospondin type 3 repeat protein/Big-like domain-containing protein
MARIALVIAALLVIAAPARADVTIGSTLQQPPNLGAGCPAQEPDCTVATTTPASGQLTAPSAGIITRWRIYAPADPQNAQPARLQVIRHGASDAFATGESAQVAPSAGRINLFETRVAIAAGDQLALKKEGLAVYLRNGAGTTELWSPALGATPAAPSLSGPAEVLINADIEPDGDADEYGDETQDNCVGVANPSQADLDRDGAGDACDTDDDGDGVPDATDGCDTVPGPAPGGCPIPPPPPNRAPTVRFRTPLAGSAIGPSFRIVLDVADDTGSPTVSVFDDDGTICVLRRAPYACTWTPTGDDVGRATLLASAVDSAGLSNLGIVRVRVERFEATLTQRQRHRRGSTRVSGRLVLPATVTRAQGCSGTVRVRLRKARRAVALTRRCTYSAKLPFRAGHARVSFGGNAVIAPT